MSRVLKFRTTAVVTTFCVGIAPFWSALGQTRGTVETPQPPAAPMRMSECNTYAARMDSLIQQVNQELGTVVKRESACLAAGRNSSECVPPTVHYSCPYAPGGVGISSQDAAPYEAQECQLSYEKNTEMQICIQQAKAWQSQHPQQGSGGAIFQLSAVSYAQEAGAALPDLLAHAESTATAGVAEWGSKALEQRQYFDLAKSLLRLSSPGVTQEDRSNLMQSLGLTAAQSMPNVNPISSIMMAVSVDIINGIYLKNMQTLQRELAAFDASAVPEADPEELNMQSLYAEATPAGSQDASAALSKLQTMFSLDANTYIGSEVSWSARTQPSPPPPTYVYTPPPPPPSQDQSQPPPPPPSPSPWFSVGQSIGQAINARQRRSQSRLHTCAEAPSPANSYDDCCPGRPCR